MEDMARSILTQLRLDDGPVGPLMLADSGSDSAHPNWTPHTKTFIPLFLATVERVDGVLIYAITIIDTHSAAHKARRQQGAPPAWERFCYRDLAGAAAFAFSFLTQFTSSKPCVTFLRADVKHKLVAADNTLPVGMNNMYAAGSPVGRLGVASVSEMKDALQALGCTVERAGV